MQIGDLFIALRGDDKQLQVDVVKSGERAGDSFANTFKSKLSSGLKAVGPALIGAGLGAIFSTAAKGAQELNAATSDFAATVGATGEEAASAQHAIAGLFKTNLQGFGEIGATMAALRTDLGLTQEEAEKATESFLKFGTATKQDASKAAKAFDDILDAWGLTASDATSIMDKLVASHQKFGGSVEANQTTLAALAPAMRTANLSIDDGIGFLNLFASKGVDSETAVKALQAALKNVKSPEELQRLMVDIANTVDPFERGKKAVDLFGKSGIAMGQVLAGVNVDLRDYAITQAEAGGATVKTAEIIEDSWGNRFQLLMKQATGALAEFGTAFGPLLVGATAVFPKLRPVLTLAGGALGTVFGKALGLGTRKVAGAAIGSAVEAGVGQAGPRVGRAGSGLGRILGIGMRTGLLAIAATAVAVVFEGINSDIQRKAAALAKQTSKFVAKATVEELQRARKGLEEELARVQQPLLTEGFGPFGAFGAAGLDVLGGKQIIGDQIDAIDAQLEMLATMVEQDAKDAAAAAAGIGPGIAAGIEDGTPEVILSAEELVKKFGTLLGGVSRAAKSQGAAGMHALSQGIVSARQLPLDAFQALVEMLAHPLPRWKEQARLVGELTSKELRDGLHSWDPAIRAQAEGTRNDILTRLQQISPAGAAIGTEAGAKLAKGLKDKDPDIRNAARDAKAAITGTLAPLPGAVKKTAEAAGASIAPAINSRDNRQDITNAVKSVVNLISRLLGGIPDATIGFNVSPSYHFPHQATGGPVDPYQPVIVGERQAEIFVPEVRGRIMPSIGMAERQGNRGGDTYQITVPIQGLIRAETPEDIARPLRRLATLGELSGLRPMLRSRTTG